MTKDEFFNLITHPELAEPKHIANLKEMIETYPYFVVPKMLLSKIYLNENNVNTQALIDKTSLYVPDRRFFYFYLHPDATESPEPRKIVRENKFTGNYFDMLQSVENDGTDTKQSLSKLAEKLKEARAKLAPESQPKSRVVASENRSNTENKPGDVTEENAKRLIKEKKYHEAILILNELYFNNPKKSIYFADQIRFLEKVIENTKK